LKTKRFLLENLLPKSRLKITQFLSDSTLTNSYSGVAAINWRLSRSQRQAEWRREHEETEQRLLCAL